MSTMDAYVKEITKEAQDAFVRRLLSAIEERRARHGVDPQISCMFAALAEVVSQASDIPTAQKQPATPKATRPKQPAVVSRNNSWDVEQRAHAATTGATVWVASEQNGGK